MTALLIAMLSIAGLGQAAFALPTTGVLDTSFNSGGSGFTNGGVETTTVQSDGKVLVGGSFTSYNGTTVGRLVRLNTNGTIDTTFSNVGAGFSGTPSGVPSVFSILVLPDSSILVGGRFLNYNGTAVNHLVKLSSTGVLDPTFVTNVGTITGPVMNLTRLSTGDIIVAGQMSVFNSASVGAIAKISDSGVMNATFNTNIGTGFTYGAQGASLWSVAELDNGNLVIGGGYFDSLKGNPLSNIASISADGTPVSSFNTQLGAGAGGPVYSVKKQSTGKVVISGSFSTFKGIPAKNILRLNSDGSVDSSFNGGGTTGFNGAVAKMTLDANDKILIGQNGPIYTYNGTAATQILRLTVDGLVDTTFTGGTVGSSTLTSITIAPSGDAYVGGYFSAATYQGSSVTRFMRLSVQAPTISPASQTISSNVGSTVATTAYTAAGFSGALTYAISGNLPAGLTFDTNTGIISGVPTAELPATTYTITVSDGIQSATATIQLTVQAAAGGGGSGGGAGQNSSNSNLALTGSNNSQLFGYAGALATALIALGGVMVAARKFAKK